METTENALSSSAAESPEAKYLEKSSAASRKELDAVESVSKASSVTTAEPTVADKLRDWQDVTLKFFANASNETLGACAVGLCASTYLVLGRVGLVLIGAVGGVVLHATWDSHLHEKGPDGQIEILRRRKELGLEVAKRALEWRDLKRREGENEYERTDKIEAALVKQKLDYSEFQPATREALTGFTDAVVRDYVKWWYGPILPKDEVFPTACRQTLTGFILSLSNHISKKRTAEPFLDFMANSTSILIVFLNELGAALRASPNRPVADAINTYLEYSPDSSLANVLNVEQQRRKLNIVAEDILESFLESKTYNCPPAKTFLREVLSTLILQSTVNTCSKAEWINGWIVYLLEEGEPELMNAIDAGVEDMTEASKTTEPTPKTTTENKNHQRRISRAEVAMQEAMREAQRLNEMIAEDDARRSKRQENLDAVDTNLTNTDTATESEIATPASSNNGFARVREHIYETEMVFDSEGNAMPSGTSSPAKMSSPVSAKSKPFTSFDQLVPQTIPTALHPESTPPAPAEPMVAIPLTLHNASITLLDMGAGNDKVTLKTKPIDEMLVQIEPASSRYSGWMATRKYGDFEPLHETLRRIAVISGVPEFGEQHANVPNWQGKSRASLIADLELYLKHAVKHERLAESEAMKKFLEKDTGLGKDQNKNVLLQGAAALDNVGKGFINVLGQGGKGIAGGGKAVLGGVQGVFGAGKKNGPARKSTSVSQISTSNLSNPRPSQDLIRTNTEASEPRPSLVSRYSESSSSFEHVGSTPQAELSEENLNLPPPPSEMPDEYDNIHTTLSPKQTQESPVESKVVHPATPTPSSKPSLPSSPLPEEAKSLPTAIEMPDGNPISSQPKPLRQPSRSDAKRSQPLSEEETRISVDLMFAIINSTYSLSSAWTIRLSLLSAAKSYLLRPNNPQLESIRSLIQDSLITANTTDEAIAGHVNKTRENALPTEEELAKWPEPLDDKQKEELRVKARKLLVERGMPQALTSVMGQAASGEALGKVFDCLQIEEVAKGLMFAMMLQSIRAVIQ